MNNEKQMPVEDVLQKLMQYGFKECKEELKDQNGISCLYVFERLDDENGIYYGCETEDDLFVFLSLVKVSEAQ